jgi:hypothetical protein
MKKLRLLGWSTGIALISFAPPVSAIAIRGPDAPAVEARTSSLGWYGSLEWTETTDWNSFGSWGDMTHWDTPERLGFRSLMLLALDRLISQMALRSEHSATDIVTTPPSPSTDVVSNGPSVPDGGATLALLGASLLGLAIVHRRLAANRGVTG